MNGNMNNKMNVKSTFSNIRPSDKCRERIFAMTVDKKKSKNQTFKRLASAALALTLFAAGTYSTAHLVDNKAKQADAKSSIVQSNIPPLSVMVAYADNYKPLSELKAGSMNKQNIFYSIHYAYINDEHAATEAEKLYKEDKANLENDMNVLSNKGYSSTISSGMSTINSVYGEATVRVYVLLGGIIALNLDDYSEVKNMTISNKSKYGELYFNYVTKANSNGKQQIGNKVSVSGKELIESQASKVFKCGTANPVNKGYELSWSVTDDLYKAIGKDVSFDLSKIKDTITFTVEFNDGAVKTASLNLYFDSNGYMHFE